MTPTRPAGRRRSRSSRTAGAVSSSQHWSLVGTVRNCAGGPTPWGSWLSCEETLESSSATGYAQNHGYIFEVPIDTVPGTPAQPVALRHLGRFAHEAVAVDPATGIVYETEDQGDGSGSTATCPPPSRLAPAILRRLLACCRCSKCGTPGYETAINQTAGVALPVEWVTITNPDPVPVSQVVSGQTLSAVFVEGLAAGGARFRRLEGCWYGNGKISSFPPTVETWGSVRSGSTIPRPRRSR